MKNQTAWEVCPLILKVEVNGDITVLEASNQNWKRVTPDGCSFAVLVNDPDALQVAILHTRLEGGCFWEGLLAGDVWHRPAKGRGLIEQRGDDTWVFVGMNEWIANALSDVDVP